jgi:hypothetical protein
MMQRKFTGDGAALGATAKFIGGFKDWVDGAHFYRHEPGQQEIAQPPLALAISFVSVGANYLRWLAEIDSATKVA